MDDVPDGSAFACAIRPTPGRALFAAPGQRMLTIVPTIDTEGVHGARPFEQFILGQVAGSGDDWGVFRIADICARHGAPATFFVDVFEVSLWGEDRFRDLTRQLSDRGFDVQLHTHPGWRDDPHDFTELREIKRKRSYLSQNLDFMAKLSLQQQISLLREGMEMLKQWTGIAPVAHRSGGYSINDDTLKALRAVGIELDSSMHHGHAHSHVTWSINSVVERDGVIELPVTLLDYVFKLPSVGVLYRKSMKTDLDSCSLEELVAYVDQAVARGMSVMNLFMHSYSLLAFDLDYRRIDPQPEDVQKLDRFLARMKRRGDVRVMSCAEMLARYKSTPEEFKGPDEVPEVAVNAKIMRLGAAKLRNRIHEAVRRRRPLTQPTLEAGA
jgi:peptidoglycan/xylan/chitin deacetylase (PgdA/CDA1 family)